MVRSSGGELQSGGWSRQSMRILFCGETFPMARTMMQSRLPADDLVACRQTAILDALDGVDVVVPLMARIDRPLMEAGRFRLIQQFGTGLEGIDLDAARERGIWVANAAASAGHTVCIVGLGAVGRSVAVRLAPFGVRL